MLKNLETMFDNMSDMMKKLKKKSSALKILWEILQNRV